MTTTRHCPVCEHPLTRHDNERESAFKVRVFCSPSCASKAGSEARAASAAAERQSLIEDLEWIIGTDSPQHVAQRLGYANADNLWRVLCRWGRHDLAARLDRHVA